MDNINVPYIVHEGDMARMERSNKRLWIVILVLIVIVIVSNIAWLCYEQQFETSSTTVEQDVDTGDNSDAIINGTGELTINGQNKTKDNNKNKAQKDR